MKKISIRVTLSLAIIGIIIFLLSCIPKTIDINYPAILYSREDSSMVKRLSITMKGKLYNPLFLNPKYTGTCVIEGYEFTNSYQLIDINFTKGYDGLGILSYTKILPDGNPDIQMIGSLWISGAIDRLCIFGIKPDEINSNAADRIIISAPAKTREEALKITDSWRDGPD